ncbi:MAG: carboxypeptidase regulatory-like domain-containing protein, partial [Acidobacteriaceae bacterium]|nr:carboxypeptidase regulatory-like domain-containing protein [Acidobacteriaceae bacterium]
MILLHGIRNSSRLGIRLTLVLACCVSFALAQSTGGIQGTVTDTTGAIVPNAAVTVTSSSTGQKQVFKTDDAGLYAAPSLPPGTYTVEVKVPGLQTTTASNVVVAVSTTARQDFTLGVATASQTVEIQATTPVVETTSASVGAVVNQKTVQEIPLNGRHFVDLALLVPGTVTPPQNGFLTSPLRGQGTSSFNSAGGRED